MPRVVEILTNEDPDLSLRKFSYIVEAERLLGVRGGDVGMDIEEKKKKKKITVDTQLLLNSRGLRVSQELSVLLNPAWPSEFGDLSTRGTTGW